MQVIDTDADLEQRSAEAAAHAKAQMDFHVAAELRGDVPALMESLAEAEPYAYTFMKESPVKFDGSLKLPLATTWQQVHEEYTNLHNSVYIHTVVPFVEIVGEFYSFMEVQSLVTNKRTGVTTDDVTIAIFPCGTARGITGELAWVQIPRGELGLGCKDARVRPASDVGTEAERHQHRKGNVARHTRYLDAWRSGDVEGIMEVLPDDAQAGMRDYVDETLLVELEGRDAQRLYYERLFETYEPQAVELLRLVVQDWYVFSETRHTVTVRAGEDAGRSLVYRIAEYMIPGHDGKFLVRLGTGTDPVNG